jgi:L-threonylcarbamoyladenylate synthase
LRNTTFSSRAEQGAPTIVDIETAVAVLRQAEAVVFPTETFYGVAVDAMNPRALDRLFELKGRDPDKPVALIAADLEMVERVVAEIPPAAARLAREFWPGPLTLVLPARTQLSGALTNREGGVGIRISPHPIALELARRLGSPLTATSANLAGDPPARTLREAWAAFGSRIAAYLDGGILQAPLPSTVIAFHNDEIQVIRAGAIAESRLRNALGA